MDSSWQITYDAVRAARDAAPCVHPAPMVANVRPMTSAQQRAIGILRDAQEPLTPAEFARRMWPAGFAKWGKCGIKGSAMGTGASLKAGAFLLSLSKRGLVTRTMGRNGFVYGVSGTPQSALPR